jgi:hypothetical protein
MTEDDGPRTWIIDVGKRERTSNASPLLRCWADQHVARGSAERE